MSALDSLPLGRTPVSKPLAEDFMKIMHESAGTEERGKGFAILPHQRRLLSWPGNQAEKPQLVISVFQNGLKNKGPNRDNYLFPALFHIPRYDA